MIWEQVLGQSGPIETLKRSAASGRLAHVLLFAGPAGVGKSLVARSLATALLCERVAESELDACGECASCRMMQAGTHPDFLRIARPEGKSELPIELLVGSRENRGREGLCHDLSLRPMAASRRVAVIDDADQMSTESSNALLKTLEEPPPYAMIILIAADSAALLPTIRSRCQTVRFFPLSPDHVARLLNQLEWTESPEDADAIAALAGGSLDVAQQLANSELRAVRSALFEGLDKPRIQSHALAQQVLDALDHIGGDSQRQRTNAQWVVHFMVDFFAKSLRMSVVGGAEETVAGAASTVEDNTEMIGAAIDRCVVAEQQLAGNVSIPLCLETLLSDLATIRST